jgi:Fungalysin metallopeptidase (M36)/Fungalysin/Thermolysin Propeptide Motif
MRIRNSIHCGRLVLVGVICGASAVAQIDPVSPLVNPAGPAPLPLASYYDIRLENGLPVAAVETAIRNARASRGPDARAQDIDGLRNEIAGLTVDDDEFLGTPHSVGSTMRFLTGAAPREDFVPREIVKNFLARHSALFEIDAGELDFARIERDFRTDHNGARHMTFQQQIGGVDLYGCEVRANLTRSGELINVANTMLPRPPSDFVTAAITRSPLDAIRAAAEDIGVAITRLPVATDAPQGAARKQVWSGSPDFRPEMPITTELVYFPRTRDDIRPAWSLILPQRGVGHTWEMLVDATTGEVLRRLDALQFFSSTQSITFNVYTGDSPAPGSPGSTTPNQFQFPLVSRRLVTIHPSDVAAWSPNNWIDDGDNQTLGNNVDAHTDLNADNLPDLPRPTGSPFRVFNFPQDNSQPASSWRDAATTQLFYLCNRYHDRLFALGFNEAAKNYQTTNFSGMGLGGDAVQADCQDGSGTNNANFAAQGADGTEGRMQMYVFTGPTPARDGDLDADIVYHEHTHGVSIRLHNGLAGTQPQSMGEGWSDFVGLCLNSQPSDDPSAVYCIGGYTTYKFLSGTYLDNYYFGIRRFPYCTDLDKNPETYADIDPAQQSFPPNIPQSAVIGNIANEVHNAGEIWCTALWEARAQLFSVHGYAANDLILQLVIDGMKLSVANPTMLQARDAILEADLIDNAGANLGQLWAGFAKRGMGASATSPLSSTTSGIHEAFDVPSLIVFQYPNGKPTELVPGEPTSFHVNVNGLATVQPLPSTGQLFCSVNNGPFVPSSSSQSSPNNYVVTLPPANCLDKIRFYFTVGTTSGTSSDPSDAPASFYSATAFSATTTLYSDNFETDLGWTGGVAGDTATTGIWVRVDPVGTAAQPEDDHTPAPGTMCWVTGQGVPGGAVGDNDVDGGHTTLLSPAFHLSSANAAVIGYWRWYSNTQGAAPNADVFTIDISNDNGASWVNAETVGPAGPDTNGGWVYHEFAVSDFVTPTDQMRVRFVADDSGTGSIVEAAVDDFKIVDRLCTHTGTPYCFGDGSGTACPCSNLGPAGSGCANSIGAAGNLIATGTASVTSDSLVLSASGMGSTVTSLFFQGSLRVNGGAGSVLADGLRCAAGTSKRLGSKINAGGASAYPEIGDIPISIKGSIPAAGGTFYYQTWYRDLASFCSVDTFNLTNGVAVVWAP